MLIGRDPLLLQNDLQKRTYNDCEQKPEFKLSKYPTAKHYIEQRRFIQVFIVKMPHCWKSHVVAQLYPFNSTRKTPTND